MINLNKKGFKIILGILVISIMLLIIGTTNVHATNKLYVENMLTHTQRLAADVDGDGFITKKDNLKTLSLGLGFSAGVMIFISFMDILPGAKELLKVNFPHSFEWLVFAGFWDLLYLLL